MISIIIPVLNEEVNIKKLVTYLQNCSLNKEIEIIVADGGSTDGTRAAAEASGATLIVSAVKGRATQMNAGARAAKYNILYFVHILPMP